jgi:ketosteroid isomerase-like protein
MSQENVNTVCRLFDAVNRRDFDAASELLHEEVTWQPLISVENDVHIGKEAVREAWERNVEAMGVRPNPTSASQSAMTVWSCACGFWRSAPPAASLLKRQRGRSMR